MGPRCQRRDSASENQWRRMDQDSGGRCASNGSAVRAQQEPWRRSIRRSILPKQSSGERERWRESSPSEENWESEEEEEEDEEGGENNRRSSGDGSSEEACSIDHDVPFRVNERLTCIGCNKRRPSFSDTESVLDMLKMPVGASNSLLKSSFSLTSLRSSTPTDNPENGSTPVRLNAERPYHSLTKKSRQSTGEEKEQWRKSWGSGISQDGKFWEGFQADYDYLMAQNILDRDQPEETGTEKGIPGAPPVWSHSEFMEHFAQLSSWLEGIQDSVCGRGEDAAGRRLRAERLEDMERQRFRLESFAEESRKLIGRWPESEGEVLRRVKHIGEKWESTEAMVRGRGKCEGEKGSKEKVVHEMRRLRNWLRELENKLKPLSFQRRWTKAELEAKAKEHMVLHRDIESHRKSLSSVLRLCEDVRSPRILTAAKALEHKYLLCYLRSFEWQYHIESLIGQHNKGSSNASNESDEEPVPKVARFACAEEERYEESDGREELDGVKSTGELSKNDDSRMDTSVEPEHVRSPTDAMEGLQPQGNNGRGGRGSTLGTESRTADSSLSCANHESNTKTSVAEQATSGGDEQRSRDVSTPPKTQTRSKEKPPNTRLFILRHPDTDSDLEKAMSKEEPKGKDWLTGQDVETTSSEGGWTYKSSNLSGKPNAGAEQKPKAAVRLDFNGEDRKRVKHFSAKNIPPMTSQEPISSSKLVEFADELFRCKNGKARKSRRGRTRRRKEMDSCDASGENTDKEGSVPRRWHGSAEGIAEGIAGGRKWQRHAPRHRPVSMSNVSWLRTPRSHSSWKSRASMSESALNQMPEFWSTGKGCRGTTGEDGSQGSVRRRRLKTRNLTAKRSESGSEGLTLSGSDSSNGVSGQQIATLVKSGSFSGVSRRQREEGATGSESEEEEEEEEAEGERTRLVLPVFRLGPSGGVVTVAAEQDKSQAEEQHSLNWDSYQEKYQSEVFSEEPLDSDTAKKVLEFGEDYGKFFGNQSDSASTRNLSFAGWGRSKIDSDSDVNDVRMTLRQSLEQLELWEMKFNKTIGGLLSGSDIVVNDCVCRTFLDEILGACKRNVECLDKLLVEVKDEIYLAKEHEDILNVKDSWENLKSTAELHKSKQLLLEMALLRDELISLGARVDATETTVTSREELEGKITQVQNELNLMKKGKSRLLQANVSVHRFLASAKHPEPALKEEVTELYQLWDQTFCRVSSQLANLQSLSQTWHDFEDHLAQLQCALRTDTLKVLDFALKSGAPATGTTLTLQDIAGILSDRTPDSKEITETSPRSIPPAPPLAALSTEGSLSDSGISDSGSEQELSEREKRLAQLKRLAKRLETILAPGSQALSNMFKRIEEAETELRKLQKTCRDLIVRSASTEEIRMIVASTPALGDLDLEGELPSSATVHSEKERKTPAATPTGESPGKESACEATECEGGKPGKKFWLWRLLCYALPFQLALVAILCLTGMLEPRCCDSLNNLELSLHPQLRYDSGPPPI